MVAGTQSSWYGEQGPRGSTSRRVCACWFEAVYGERLYACPTVGPNCKHVRIRQFACPRSTRGTTSPHWCGTWCDHSAPCTMVRGWKEHAALF